VACWTWGGRGLRLSYGFDDGRATSGFELYFLEGEARWRKTSLPKTMHVRNSMHVRNRRKVLKKRTRKNHVVYAAVIFLSASLGASFPAIGTPPDADQPTSSTPDGGPIVGDTGEGLGPNEVSLGNAIQTVCPRLVNERLRAGANRGPGEVDLQRRCTEVVLARGNGVGGSELNGILREWNVDEAAAQNRGLVELAAIRSASVIGRLEQLRVADAGGSLDEAVVYRTGPGQLNYHFETGGAAGDGDFSRWSVYLNGELFSGDRDQTSLEAGFDLDGGRVTIGGDYRVDNNTFVGASLDYITSSADFDNDSELDTDGIDVTLYGTRYTDDGLYFEGTIGLGSNDYEQDRLVRYAIPAVPPPAGSGPGVRIFNRVATGDTCGDHFVFSASLSYLDATIDGFTETIAGGGGPGSGLALRVRDQDVESLRSSVGAQISKAISTESGVVIPFARADWLHEFENDSRTIVASFANDILFDTTTTFGLTTEEPDADYFRLGGGVSAVFAGGVQGFVAVESVLGLSDLSYYSVTAGIRKEL